MNIVHPSLAKRGIVGSQPTIYWAEAYANFGWIGALSVPIYVGFFMFLCNWLVTVIKHPAVRGTITVWAGFHLGRFAYSGFSWSLLPVTLGVGFVIIFCCHFIMSCKKQPCIKSIVAQQNAKGTA
jgi:hypothetical protein